VLQHGVQQLKRADQVSLNELARPVDGTVHVALGGKMHHCVRSELSENLVNKSVVVNTSFDKEVIGGIGDAFQVAQISRVGQFVEVNNSIAAGHPAQDEIRAYETGSSSDKQRLRHSMHSFTDVLYRAQIS
jgi:hypothetical protein